MVAYLRKQRQRNLLCGEDVLDKLDALWRCQVEARLPS